MVKEEEELSDIKFNVIRVKDIGEPRKDPIGFFSRKKSYISSTAN